MSNSQNDLHAEQQRERDMEKKYACQQCGEKAELLEDQMVVCEECGYEVTFDFYHEQQKEAEEEMETVKYLCPDCKAEVVWIAQTDSVKCPKCEYTAPDTYFCEEVKREGREEMKTVKYGIREFSEDNKAHDTVELYQEFSDGTTQGIKTLEIEFIVRAVNSHAELLEALKELFEYADKRIGNHGPINMWTKVKNAIVKAEGRAL